MRMPWTKEPETERERHVRNVQIALANFAEAAKRTGSPLALDVALTLAKVEKEWKPA